MRLPVYFPPVEYTRIIPEPGISIAQLCAEAGVPCRASGRWAERQVVVSAAPQQGRERVVAEPGDWQKLRVLVPPNITSKRDRARWALGALAYAVFDGVARASITGLPWTRPSPPRGRQPAGRLA